ncbi:MAG: UPF0182 family protein [Candidatus Aenigmatarchaeota archaeon]|nr:MAG: UPF0182 family protein [Candidatus Aenigmarchaeota archaeon]
MKPRSVIFALVIAVAAITPMLLGVFGDWLWFSSVGYESVFAKILLTSVAIGTASFIVFFSVAYASIWFSKRLALGKRKTRKSSGPFAAVAGIIGLVIGIIMSRQWETVLQYVNASSFGASDPVFSMNNAFYVFTLPFYSLVLNFLLATFLLSFVLSVASYIFHSSGVRIERKEMQSDMLTGTGSEIAMSLHVSWDRLVPLASAMAGILFVMASAHIWLAQYALMFSSRGAVYGAGYTDINITIPMLNVLSIVSFAIAILFMANVKIRKTRFIRDGITAFIIIAVLGTMISGAVQALVVSPNEFNLEKPYLEMNIHSTLSAYGLESIRNSIFSVDYNLTAQDINDNNATISNIRLWDWRPLKQTYQQLQLFRTYYEFNDVDIDRYDIGGTYKQVMLSAREMNTNDLPAQAQTWVNKHLVYTHGYGVVMNPVDKVSEEGLPIFYMKDIPPVSSYMSLDVPQIYYGEKANDYVITSTSTNELDYPSGDKNIYASYTGHGGIELSDLLRRLTFAVKFSSVELLVSGSIDKDSKLLMNRNIMDRVSAIAPFLEYDPDPYIVISDGRLYWILDAYTTTSMYPYSEPVRVTGMDKGSFNYIRNSVKVTIDAYSGDVRFYVIDGSDPLISTYSKMFPSLFKDFSEMPASLASHIRYPEGLFNVQAHIYSTYHMKDPRVFYNREDVWVIPDEIYRGSRQKMQTYYIIMKLPGEEREEFIQMIPFTPKGKENLIGWMAARSDMPNYGEAIVYQFSKQELTYGPMQIEARIDQDPEISQLITLWSQSGSNVLRGNTLIIPIENSLLYIEPLYLEATEKGTLPQLQRVIAVYGNKLAMKNTLKEAINAIFGTDLSMPGGQKPSAPVTAEEKLARIAELYDNAQAALAEGDLGSYQEYINQIGEITGN